jgi:hypothetical protein
MGRRADGFRFCWRSHQLSLAKRRFSSNLPAHDTIVEAELAGEP